jgi:hypothetical protein
LRLAKHRSLVLPSVNRPFGIAQHTLTAIHDSASAFWSL